MSAPPPLPVLGEDDDPVEAWARSGAMALTGRADGPALGPPLGLVPGLRQIAAVLADRSARIGRSVVVDPLVLLGERAAIAGLTRAGTTSCGGGTRLLRAADGWLAVSLARPDDWASVPAWLGADLSWTAVERAVAHRPVAEVVAQAVLLGLPVAALPHPTRSGPGSCTPGVTAPGQNEWGGLGVPVMATCLEAGPGDRPLAGRLVVDLTSLWAGPLCGSLLAEAGARVVKVESTMRPDGARLGPAAFFDLLHAGKEDAVVDVTTAVGRSELAHLLVEADVVLEASRPRALEQLGIGRAELQAAGGPQVWLSITGHGRVGPARDRVAFGDDAAVAGGLVVWDHAGPCFCADAVADPATGLTAAAAVVAALAEGGRWTIDVTMAMVAASLAGPTLPVPAGTVAAPPRVRTR